VRSVLAVRCSSLFPSSGHDQEQSSDGQTYGARLGRRICESPPDAIIDLQVSTGVISGGEKDLGLPDVASSQAARRAILEVRTVCRRAFSSNVVVRVARFSCIRNIVDVIEEAVAFVDGEILGTAERIVGVDDLDPVDRVGGSPALE